MQGSSPASGFGGGEKVKNRIISISLAVILALCVGLISCGGEEVPEMQEYNLAISSTEGGEVTTPGEGTYTYDEGTVVDLMAEPDEGYHFVSWTGDIDTIINVNAAPTTITMNGNYTITSNFALGNVTGSTQNTGGLVGGNSGTVSNIMVVANPVVACACAHYTVTFTTTLALSEFQKIFIKFPAGTGLTKSTCGGLNVSLEWYDGVVNMAWIPVGITFTVVPYADLTQELHIMPAACNSIPAGPMRVQIFNVANPPAGTYTLKLSTQREPTEVDSPSFTIIAGPTISLGSTVWCMGSPVGIWFLVDWGQSCVNNIKNIVTNGGCSLNWSKTEVELGVSNVTIDSGNLNSCSDLQPCANVWLNIEFDVGCNAAIAL